MQAGVGGSVRDTGRGTKREGGTNWSGVVREYLMDGGVRNA
jgi:hypothetical protein